MRLLDPPAADDERLSSPISTGLINDVYADRRARPLGRRRDAHDSRPVLAELIRAGEIAVATPGAEVVGSIRLHDVTADTGEFGMLVAAPDQRGTGVGRALVASPKWARPQNAEMQLELLVPRGWSHPGKEFLQAWYARIGYRRSGPPGLADAYPALAPQLATPCDFVVYEKSL